MAFFSLSYSLMIYFNFSDEVFWFIQKIAQMNEQKRNENRSRMCLIKLRIVFY